MGMNDGKYSHAVGLVALRYSEEKDFEPEYFDIPLIDVGARISRNVAWSDTDLHVPETSPVEVRLYIKEEGKDAKRLHRSVVLPVPQTRLCGFLRLGIKIVSNELLELYLCDRESVANNRIEHATKAEIYKPIPDVVAREAR